MRNKRLLVYCFLFMLDKGMTKWAYKLTSFTYRDINKIGVFKAWAEVFQYRKYSLITISTKTKSLVMVKFNNGEVNLNLNLIKESGPYKSTGAKRWYVVPNSLKPV